ncbi:MAG: hypothetical protein HQK96_08095 [Nitrospirae bacterium]|nr:hypothetical protein [Nitrospirota bacterium]
MTVQELINNLRGFGEHCLDNEVVIKVSERGFPATPVVYVESVGPGFDWDDGKMILYPKTPVIKKVEGERNQK